jgi:hypothetical protein
MSIPASYNNAPSEYKNSIDTSTSPDVRYILVYNGTSNDIYPEIQAFNFPADGADKSSITDITNDLPSGFKLAAGDYKLLKLSRQVNSGRIATRTGCTYINRYNWDTDVSGQLNLFCSTGDCPMTQDSLPKSQNGLLCSDIGGKAPTTLIEFTFDQSNNEYYDISQVDGNNLSATITPVKNAIPTVPDTIDKDYWCQNISCNPSGKKEDCPPEMRVYDNDNNFVACQSICSALGTLNYDENGKYVGPGKLPDSKNQWADSSGPLSVNEPAAYKFLQTLHDTKYYWDPDESIPSLNDPYNRPETKTGRWLPDDDGTKCTNSADCISASTLVCCMAKAGKEKGDPTNTCGDLGANLSPNFPLGNDQGCSPYVDTTGHTTKATLDYFKHVCWSENWPKSSNGKNYHDVFKNQCKSAYSWAFDDLNSTYHCGNGDTTTNSKPPVHYYIEYLDYGGPEPAPKPEPPKPTPKPEPPPEPDTSKPSTKKDWTSYIVVGVIILVLLLFLIVAIINRRVET